MGSWLEWGHFDESDDRQKRCFGVTDPAVTFLLSAGKYVTDSFPVFYIPKI